MFKFPVSLKRSQSKLSHLIRPESSYSCSRLPDEQDQTGALLLSANNQQVMCPTRTPICKLPLARGHCCSPSRPFRLTVAAIRQKVSRKSFDKFEMAQFSYFIIMSLGGVSRANERTNEWLTLNATRIGPQNKQANRKRAKSSL